MTTKNPYEVIKHLHVTEKSMMLENLKTAGGSRSLQRCKSPKYVFIVDKTATKPEIAHALEEIYKAKEIKVKAVNTSHTKGKPRRVRGRLGMKAAFKKAVVTLQEGDSLDTESMSA
jgi:large subunit ribosomal protein L23